MIKPLVELIDTGNNPALGKNVLQYAKKRLVKDLGCFIVRDCRDASGRNCAFEAKSSDGLNFICAARSTGPVKRGALVFVSSQESLVREARRNMQPLVIYWEEAFHVFSAGNILLNNMGVNIRADLGPNVKVRFLNFSPLLSCPWFGNGLQGPWECANKKARTDLRSYDGSVVQ